MAAVSIAAAPSSARISTFDRQALSPNRPSQAMGDTLEVEGVSGISEAMAARLSNTAASSGRTDSWLGRDRFHAYQISVAPAATISLIWVRSQRDTPFAAAR